MTTSQTIPTTPRGGGLAALSIRHPIGVVMITLAIMVLGAFAFARLQVNLLPDIIYPEVRVRILDPGVPATVMEDRITRQLEEQLAITEDAIAIESQTSEGQSRVNLSFPYGKDINIALRDASTRLDRAKRFLPDSIDPPVIYKYDPSQLPVLEFVVSSPLRDPVELREWVDYQLSKWFINLPGIAAAEVGGGLQREIQILPDQQRLAGLGLSIETIIETLEQGNRDEPAGRLTMSQRELSSRTAARFTDVKQIATLPLSLSSGETIPLYEVAQVLDTHEDERMKVRLNGVPGIKLTLQKQPSANTVGVVDLVNERLQWLQDQEVIPEDITISNIGDQSIYVRSSLRNAAYAAISGATLAMIVVFIFLGNLRRTLIIGSAIPVAALVTFGVMEISGLSLNIMTLGGLAVGIGMLVDSTIVMLENIVRHQRHGESGPEAGRHAAAEVNSAIVASTSTNLAAVLPFLFIGGLVGLLFQELIMTISAAIIASLFVSLTLVPALGSRIPITKPTLLRRGFDRGLGWLQRIYSGLIRWILKSIWLQLLIIVTFLGGLYTTLPDLADKKEIFLPSMDDGRVRVRVSGDPGMTVKEMDHNMERLETMLQRQPEVEAVFSIVGGSIFGRSERQVSNRTSMVIQLVSPGLRNINASEWVKQMRKKVNKLEMAGIKVSMRPFGIRGIRTSRGEEEFSLRLQGPDLDRLSEIATLMADKLKEIPELQNIEHSGEDLQQELAISIDRHRTASLGLNIEDIGRALRIAMNGILVSDLVQGDLAFPIRVQLPKGEINTPQDMEAIILFPTTSERSVVYLGDVAKVNLVSEQATILRDYQRRIIEISAAVDEGEPITEIAQQIETLLQEIKLPEGYSLYQAGSAEALQEGRALFLWLLGLALFLVFVVMAVQYESLKNPLVILIGVPFAATGISLGVNYADLPLSMPVWLGMIMLAGIVVNNAIIMIEMIEILKQGGKDRDSAISKAAGLRLRPILMTTLTTSVGLLPLALGLGEGSEMLQPLAITIISGLLFSLLVTLLLIPVIYRLAHSKREPIPQPELPLRSHL